jgi:hypothetical protein
MSKLTDAEKDEIAELAAKKAYDILYIAVGKSVVKKILWLLGAAAAVVWFYLQNGSAPK